MISTLQYATLSFNTLQLTYLLIVGIVAQGDHSRAPPCPREADIDTFSRRNLRLLARAEEVATFYSDHVLCGVLLDHCAQYATFLCWTSKTSLADPRARGHSNLGYDRCMDTKVWIPQYVYSRSTNLSALLISFPLRRRVGIRASAELDPTERH